MQQTYNQYLHLCSQNLIIENHTNVMNKKMIFLTHLFKCKTQDLFFMLYKPEALRNWLAPEVTYDSKSKMYAFHWKDAKEVAKLTEMDEKYHILSWEWVENENSRGEYVRFQVAESEEEEGWVELIIEDFCEAGEENLYREKWDKMLKRLEVLVK